MRRTLSTVLIGGAALALLLTSGVLHVDVQWRDRGARAIDLDKLFGGGKKEAASEGDDEPAAGEPFWEEAPAGREVVPGIPPSFADLAERASPAVVNIQTSKTVKRGGAPIPNPFEEFFGGPFEEFFRPHEFQVPSLGSGFVISEDGYIVTNNHVVEDVDEINVAFLDGQEMEAEVVGRDPKTDIALIRVKPDKPLPTLPLGDSESVRPGDWVLAIGNPYGLEHTVTAGIVSAKHRIIGQGSYDDFIQTDAAINPGNSGGPLLNLRGEVVGINTAINPRANTIGFAVPIDMAKEILPQLRVHGYVTRGWLGVVIQEITPDLAEELGLEDDEGALVSKVDPKGPAAKAGLKRGDVIVGFDGRPVHEMKELPRMVAATRPGRMVEVEVIRKGERKTFQVEIGRLEEPQQLAGRGAPGPGGERAFGLRVQDLTPDVAEELGLEDVEHGVVITGVERGSPADRAGLRRGDVIAEVDQEPVEGLADFREKLEGAGERVLLLVQRGPSAFYRTLKRPKSED